MVGTIFGLGLSQQFQADGEPHSGCKLYLYEAGTSTPVVTYEDFGLTTGLERPHPIVADAAGRIPAFWVADGSYRVRLTDSSGNEIFDISSITAIGASSGAAQGGGTSSENVFAVGDLIFSLDDAGGRTGFVRANGKTIGNAASGGTERANADCSALFEFLWNQVSDTYATVSGSRGASASADFSAGKTIIVPSLQGRSPIGMDDMGNTAAGVIAAATEPGKTGGDTGVTLVEANLPSHTHTFGTLVVDDHSHAVGTLSVDAHKHGAGSLTYRRANGEGEGPGPEYLDDEEVDEPVTGETAEATATISGATANAGATISGATAAAGSGTAFSTVSPWLCGTWYVKL